MRRLVVHPLPAAPAFTGRERELETLTRAVIHDPRTRVVSLVGIGGPGKTAIAAEFLERLAGPPGDPDEGRPHALFVWSFYVDQDPSEFLRQAYAFFANDESRVDAHGAGVLHLLVNLLA